LFWMLCPAVLDANGNDGHDHDHAGETAVEQQATTNSAYDISFETHPEPQNIIPDGGPVELIFRVTHDGNPAEGVELSYRVYTPEKSFWFGTEFPVVEGTQMFEGTVRLPRGQQSLQAILPIRGTYQIKTTVRGPEGTASENFNFDVPANPAEIRNLSIFLLILFFIGGIGGYIFSRTRYPQNATTWMGLLLGAGLILFTGQPVYAHGEGNWDPHDLERQVGSSQLLKSQSIHAEFFPQPVSVGEMVRVQYHSEIREPVLVESHFVHSEGGLEMIRQSHWLDNGEAEIRVQLFDGADHFLVSRFYRPGTEEHDHAHNHDHGEKPSDHPEDESVTWEAETTYSLSPGSYEIRFEESGDPAMKWQFARGQTIAEESRHNLFSSCNSIDPGSSFPANTNCYNLQLNSDGTDFTLNVTEGGVYTLFTEHLPREFNMKILDSQENPAEILEKRIPGKGEYLGQSVRRITVVPISPPVDSIVKSLVTLLVVAGLGTWIGFRLPGWLGGDPRK